MWAALFCNLKFTEITEVNLSAFVYWLFHEDSLWNLRDVFMKPSVISVHKALHWVLYHVWFQNKSELYNIKFMCNLQLRLFHTGSVTTLTWRTSGTLRSCTIYNSYRTYIVLYRKYKYTWPALTYFLSYWKCQLNHINPRMEESKNHVRPTDMCTHVH